VTDVTVHLTLPDELMKRAEAKGLLTDNRLQHLIEAELERADTWERFNRAAGEIREAASEMFGVLSDDEILQLVTAEIHAMRLEQDTDSSR